MFEQKFHVVGRKRLTAYARQVVLDRAVCDFRDGLKPVHRRILWAMKEGGYRSAGSFVKCARITGDTMGKYHPHGNSSIYDALVGMVQAPVPLIVGQGNFGNFRDPPAAERYTEAKMSKLADHGMFGGDYIETVTMVPNYDDKEKEPVYLPALFPNLLINGCQGIAYGVAANVPPIHPETVMALVNRRLKGETITSKMVFDTLRFNWFSPSECVTADDKIMTWLESGKGPLHFRPNYEHDERKRTITFTSVPPNFNFANMVDRLGEKAWVTDFEDITDRNSKSQVSLRLKIKGGTEDFEKRLVDAVNLFTNHFSCATTITTRAATLEDTTFDSWTVSSFIHHWCTYRTDLERQYQGYRIRQFDKDVATQDLLLLVIKHLEAVAKIIRISSDPKPELKGLLQIDDTQVETVLGFTLQRLTRINRDDVLAKKQKLLAGKKEAQGWQSNPTPKVLSDMNGYKSLIRVR